MNSLTDASLGNQAVEQSLNNHTLEGKLDYAFFTFHDTNTGKESTHKICLQTDGNAICNNRERTTWLHVAAEAGHEFMLRGFTKQGSQGDLEARNAKDLTPLMVALKANKEKSVEILLDAGADIHAKYKCESNYWSTALHLAATTDARIMQMIFKKSGDNLNLELEDASNQTPLYCAIRAKRTDIAEMLIEKEVNIFHKSINEKNTTNPLAAAAFACETKIVKLLVARGVKIAECSLTTSYFDDNHKQQTRTLKASPIFGAVVNGCDEEMVEVLIAAGDNPHRILSDNSNILSWINPKNNPKILECFLKMKIDPNRISHHNGCPPLITISRGSAEHLQLLLQYGADPNLRDKEGSTALDKACLGLHPDDARKIEALLNHGADPNIKNAFGTFAYHHTKQNLSERAFELTKLFLSKGAKIDDYAKKRFDNSFLNNDKEFRKLINDHYSECVIL